MRIKTALILCAGLGKRLNPLTLKKPKPLLQIKNQTILEDCINTVIKLKVENIFLNTFYLSEQIVDFFKNKNFSAKIKIIEDGKNILDTGGAVLNMINHSDSKDFFVFNPVKTINKITGSDNSRFLISKDFRLMKTAYF